MTRLKTSFVFFLFFLMASPAKADWWDGKFWSYSSPYRLEAPNDGPVYSSESAVIDAYSNFLQSLEVRGVPFTCETHIGSYTLPFYQSAGAGLPQWGEPWASYAIVYVTGCHEDSILKNFYSYVYAKGYPFNADLSAGTNSCQSASSVQPLPKTMCGNPINVLGGNKYQPETDFEKSSIRFARYYNSVGDGADHGFGRKWTHTYSRAVLGSVTGMSIAGTQLFYVERPEGGRRRIIFNNGVAKDEGGVETNILKPIFDQADSVIGWEYGRKGEEVEIFDGDGRLVSILKQNGTKHDLFYDQTDKLVSISDQFGEYIYFEYLTSGNIGEIKSNGVAIAQFAYNADGMLSAATYADGKSRKYIYNEQSNTANINSPWLLTSVKDENDLVFSRFWYAVDGSAIQTSHAGGVESYAVTYPLAQDGVASVDLPLGAVRQMNFDLINDQQKVVSITTTENGSSRIESFSYDYMGRLEVFTDMKGVETKYGYGSFGRVSAVTESNNSLDHRRHIQQTWSDDFGVLTESKVYDATASLPGVQVKKTNWTHNSRGQVLSATVTDPVASISRTVTTAYCELTDVATGTCPFVGLVKAVNGPRTDVADTFSYTYRMSDDAPGCGTGSSICLYRKGHVWKITNALGQVSEVLEYDTYGRPQSIKDPNGVVIDFEYSPRGWITARKVRGTNSAVETDDQIIRIEYWPTGMVKKVTQPDGAFTSFSYDGAHRLTDIADNQGNSIAYTLNAVGERTQENTKDSQGVLMRTLSRTYNTLGQLQAIHLPNPNPAISTPVTTGFAYDDNGNLDTTTDALTRVTDNNYDPLDRLKRTLQDVNGIAAETKFTYDVLDNLTKVNDPNGLDTNYSYNGLSDLMQLTSPDAGITTYTYDSAGNRESQTDARGITTTYGYDALNRLISIAYPTTSLNSSYAYDTAQAACQSGETFTVGRLAKIADGSGNTVYCYDRFGNLVRKVQTTNGKVFTLRYVFNVAGQLTSMVYPDGAIVDYVRDTQGRVTEVGAQSVGGARQVVLTNATYYPFGPVTEWTYGNNRVMKRSLNQNYQPGFVEVIGAGGLNIGYEFDDAGNLKKLRTANQVDPPLRAFGYDNLNRLTENKDGTTNAVLEGYTYDKTGNRTSATVGPATTAYSYLSGSHRLDSVGATARAYDNVGNTTLIGGAAKEFIYNDLNRMSQYRESGVAKMSYVYNGRGEQVRKYASSTTNEYSLYGESGQWLGDYDDSGAPVQQIVWLDNLPVSVLAGASTSQKLYYVEADALGSPRVVVDPTRGASGTAVWTWDLAGEAFGNTAPHQDPDGDSTQFVFDMRFPGQLYDVVAGVNYNYFRDYQANTGRYAESDPIGLRGGVSTYGYVGGSPLMWKDQYGLVRWSGTALPSSIGGIFSVGAYIFDLTSQCVNGRKANVLVRAWGAGLGIGIKYLPPANATVDSNISLEDHLSDIYPANFNGLFATSGAGFDLGPLGGDCTAYQLGSEWTPAVTRGPFSCSWGGGGLDAGANFMVGKSTLVKVKWESCNDCEPIDTPFK